MVLGVGRFHRTMVWFKSPFAGFLRSSVVREVGFHGWCRGGTEKLPLYYWLPPWVRPHSALELAAILEMAQIPLDKDMAHVGGLAELS